MERAVALLDLLAQDPTELGTNELARRTGLSGSTVSRTLATLAAGGLVEHVPGSGRYRLGVRLVQLGHAALAGLDLRALARPHLRALVAATGETATISVSGEPDAVTVEFVQSPSSVQSVAQLGRPSIAHATAAGKVVLAWGGVPLPPAPLRPFTQRTITDPEALSREVARVRKRGWARAVREREEELSALAAPVFGASRELVAALGLQGPASRFDRDAMQAALGDLLDRARTVSHALGWKPTDEEGA
ncbi:MAG: IclR family transcriptional regulator [Gaiellaceae bacterium]